VLNVRGTLHFAPSALWSALQNNSTPPTIVREAIYREQVGRHRPQASGSGRGFETQAKKRTLRRSDSLTIVPEVCPVDFKKEWRDVVPKLRYDIYKWVLRSIAPTTGAAVITLAALFMKSLNRVPAPIFYGILFLIACLCFWFLGTRLSLLNTQGQTRPPDPKSPNRSLQEEVFKLCRELSAYLGERVARPDEDKMFSKYKHDGKLLAERYDSEIQSWDDKLSAGYWLNFKDRAVDLRHELVLQDVRDNALDEALSALDRNPTKDYARNLQTVIEKFRYAASTLR
jgi:hypothetical protein